MARRPCGPRNSASSDVCDPTGSGTMVSGKVNQERGLRVRAAISRQLETMAASGRRRSRLPTACAGATVVAIVSFRSMRKCNKSASSPVPWQSNPTGGTAGSRQPIGALVVVVSPQETRAPPACSASGPSWSAGWNGPADNASEAAPAPPAPHGSIASAAATEGFVGIKWQRRRAGERARSSARPERRNTSRPYQATPRRDRRAKIMSNDPGGPIDTLGRTPALSHRAPH